MTIIKEEYVGNKAKDKLPVESEWWHTSGQKLANNVVTVVNNISKTQSLRNSLNLRYARLYSDMELLGKAYRTAVSNTTRMREQNKNRISYNIVKSCTDTASSKISKNKPKPEFITSGGNWEQAERAKKLSKYIEGVYYDVNAYELGQKMFVDACVFGTGALKIFTDEGRVKVERVHIDEIVVDDYDGLYGKPRQMHQIKHVSKDVLIGQFPKYAKEINDQAANTSGSSDWSAAQLIKVVESWHLQSGTNGKDGKHAICIESVCLYEEPYKKDYFPFVFMRWSDRLTGFFGQGLAEELTGIQVEINKLLRNIQKAQHLMAVPRVAINTRDNTPVRKLSNEIGSVIPYKDKPPTWFTPTAMNAEVYNHLKWLIEKGYEVTGVSQMSATSKKPSGLDAAVAIREYQDIETERFIVTGQRYERVFMDLSKIIIDMSRDLYSKDNNLKIKIDGGKFIETIKWKDVDLKDDEFVMKVWPISFLPSTPSGRLQKVQEMVQSGMITQAIGMKLLDFPDLETAESLEMADANLVDKTLSNMILHNRYDPPEPQQNLKYAFTRAQQVYLKGRFDAVPEDRLELVLRYMDDAQRLQIMAQPAPPPVVAPGTQPELAVAAPLPESDLIPQV